MTKEKKNSHLYRVLLVLLVLAGLWFTARFVSDRARVNQLAEEAEAALAQGSYASADQSYDKILEIEELNVTALLGKARVSLETGDYVRAGDYLNRLEEAKVDTPEYRSLLYHYAYQSEDYALAESLLASGTDYVPDVSEYRTMIQGLLDDEYYAKASLAAQRALEFYPEESALLLPAFDAYMANNDVDLAKGLYEDGLELETVDRLNALSKVYDRQNEPAEATKLRVKSLELLPNQKDLITKVSDFYVQDGDVRAYWDFRKTLLMRGLELPSPQVNLFGNEPANVRYRGIAAEQNGRIYYTDSVSQAIYQVSSQTLMSPRLVFPGRAEGLNIVGDELYFISASDGNTLSRMKTDGTGFETLSTIAAANPLVWGDTIYFLERGGQGRLMQLDRAGGTPEAVTDLPVKHYAPDGEWIYFTGTADRGLYRVPLAGGESEKLLAGTFSDLVVDEYSRLYFLANNGEQLLRSANDGTDVEILSEVPALYLNYGGNKLFYVSFTPHSMKVNGADATALTSNLSEELAYLGDWVFSIGFEAEGANTRQIFAFRPDGTEWTILSGSVGGE